MRGQPLVCKCPQCGLKAVSGARARIYYLGQSKRVTNRATGRKSGRGVPEKHHTKCGACGHIWWSSYKGVPIE